MNDDAKQTEFNENLILLSTLGKKALLVIDNFNVPADHDAKLPDLLELECDVIFISYSHKDSEYFEFTKQSIERIENDPRYHTPGPHEPRTRTFTLSEEEAKALGWADDDE